MPLLGRRSGSSNVKKFAVTLGPAPGQSPAHRRDPPPFRRTPQCGLAFALCGPEIPQGSPLPSAALAPSCYTRPPSHGTGPTAVCAGLPSPSTALSLQSTACYHLLACPWTWHRTIHDWRCSSRRSTPAVPMVRAFPALRRPFRQSPGDTAGVTAPPDWSALRPIRHGLRIEA